MSVADALEEFCPECGSWVSYLVFNYDIGWCHTCVGETATGPRCTRCGRDLPPGHGRTTCTNCRHEQWLSRHIDELEFLVVVKGYSVSQARLTIVDMVRPICQYCRKPIKGAHEGALFHKNQQNRACHSAYMKFARHRKQGLSVEEALAAIGLTRVIS